MNRRRPTVRFAGFSLLELIIVVTVIGILATIALPAMKNVPRRAAESVLKNDLRTFRDVIDQFHGDKGQYPAELEELVTEGYLREIPIDPITKTADSWVPVLEEVDPENPPPESELGEDLQPGVWDVRSGSEEVSLDGTPYNEW